MDSQMPTNAVAPMFDRLEWGRRLNVAPRTVDRLISTKIIPAPALSLGGKLRRWTEGQYAEFLERQSKG
jgi:hypothetical protein